ncbi:MAG TPA: glycosyltransferase family 2 protein [Puia sp.]|nr:glycosyltransferase family 2 protein [Puia sp.]
MHLWLFTFIFSCLLVFYNYIGYILPVYLWNRLRKPRTPRKPHTPHHPTPPASTLPKRPEDWPTVSFIVAAYNEKDCIREKILNSLEQDYPADRLEFIFITDGSTDETPQIAASFPRIHALHEPERKGKSAAINRAVTTARNEILIFSDANTILNREATRNIARHYLDPKVGGVAGEKKVLSATANAREVGEGEGLYWKYESFLKRQDSAFYSVVGAAGELFSLRTDLYEPLPHNIILDDFVLSLRVTEKGLRVLYEPEAYAMELPSFSIADEQKRKVRIAAGGFQAIGLLTPLLAFWRYPRLTYLYVSHRVLRWALSPLCLILALLSNAILFATTPNLIYGLLLAAQILFYGTAALAALFPGLKKKSRLIKLGSYFVFMNTSVILGFFRFLRGRQAATWEKARRVQSPA